MVHPLLNMRLSGVVVYQGESNCDQPHAYACMFPALIADWRVKFELRRLLLTAYPLHDFCNGSFTNLIEGILDLVPAMVTSTEG